VRAVPKRHAKADTLNLFIPSRKINFMARKKIKKKKWHKDDEDKILFFLIGLVFGVALTAGMNGFSWYAIPAALAIFIVVLLIEQRQKKRRR